MTASTIRPSGASPCTIVVCRGCCCGDSRKHPGADHVWQLDRLRAAAATSAGTLSVRTTDCLGPCDQANIVVVRPSAAGRRRGGRAAWIGWAMGDDCTQDIIDWASAGGPGLVDPPPALTLQFVSPPRDARTRSRTDSR
ncbi:(2Fe-2S) ferredoxin domain-containing protein, partial [Streptomyces sparsus]